MTDITPTVPVTVRFFAAASAAAKSESAVLALGHGATIADVANLALLQICG